MASLDKILKYVVTDDETRQTVSAHLTEVDAVIWSTWLEEARGRGYSVGRRG